ncbi:serine/threonine protein kinase [Microbacterium nanhaiense]|uniref:non-specific serine/threonine protein kinase n=1 Tax=Microbacterium nanhaiense TaxID=1301026 RepID=A0ABQ2N5K3_9MICO|nr:Stk1 family PASTA domain-containing Ser/Thr kinase [Microbacterium nanhaiense]GGO63796.1 serine/threonine protein kinase [Microbacterium nanhaiense]
MTDEPTQALQAPEERILSGRYRVDSLIGRGGMATVHRGYDLTLGRTVAIKILDRDLARDNTFRTRFRLEAQAASRMAHASIVRVYDAGEDLEDDPAGGITHTPFIVMELVRGRLLSEIAADAPLSAEDAARYVDGILEALEYSHRAGVVHRDIKPGNVMVTDDGQVKVMDFGIARAVSDTSATVAETTTILGTAAYFSPEQAQGEPVDARADLYSTGVVLYELLTGRPPFVGGSPVAVAYQHVREAPVPPTQRYPDAPAQLDPIVMRALAKDPAQRYPDAATFREALDAALDGKTLSQRQLTHLADELYGDQRRAQHEIEHTFAELSSENGVARTQSGPPTAWVWAAIALIVASVAALAFWVVESDPMDLRVADTVDVVDVTGWTASAAERELTADGLEVQVSSQPSDSVPEGAVIETQPGPGTSLELGAHVDILVSDGPLMAKIPSLVGGTEEAARAALDGDSGLQLGRILPLNDPEAAAGTVLAAEVDGDEVDEGEEVLEGSRVDLTVATGRVTINDLTGMPYELAKKEFEALGLTVTQTRDDGCTATNPLVVETQNPAAGDVDIHSTVTLRVCAPVKVGSEDPGGENEGSGNQDTGDSGTGNKGAENKGSEGKGSGNANG